MKYLVVLLAVLLVFGGMGAFMDGVYDFRTDVKTQEFTVETTAGVTSANVQLSTALWGEDVANVSISSNSTADTPVAYSYTTASRNLNVTGLAQAANRTLTVEYDIASLTDYPGVSDGVLHVPVIVTAALIVIVLGVVLAVVIGIIKRGSL